MTGVTKQRRRKLHDRFIAIDRHTKGENVFLRWRSKLSWISGVKRLWEELCSSVMFSAQRNDIFLTSEPSRTKEYFEFHLGKR